MHCIMLESDKKYCGWRAQEIQKASWKSIHTFILPFKSILYLMGQSLSFLCFFFDSLLCFFFFGFLSWCFESWWCWWWRLLFLCFFLELSSPLVLLLLLPLSDKDLSKSLLFDSLWLTLRFFFFRSFLSSLRLREWCFRFLDLLALSVSCLLLRFRGKSVLYQWRYKILITRFRTCAADVQNHVLIGIRL